MSHPSAVLSGPSDVQHGAEEAATLTKLERLVRSVPDPVVRGFLLMADDSIVVVLPYALAIAARLALADACGPDGSTAEELAVAVGFAAEPVMSLMNALSGAGFFARDQRGRFTPTSWAQCSRQLIFSLIELIPSEQIPGAPDD